MTAHTTIWKARLDIITGPQIIVAPKGAKFLCAREQSGQPCVWFSCDPKAPLTNRSLEIHPTGGTGRIGGLDIGSYIGTCFIEALVLHVYDITGS